MRNWIITGLGLLILLLFSCKQQVEFAPAPEILEEETVPEAVEPVIVEAKPAAPPPPQRVNIKKCEKAVKIPSGSITSPKLILDLPLACDYDIVKEKVLKRTVDIVFLLDISGSMQENINAVLHNVAGFVESIEYLKPRIALIPFVDDIPQSHVVPLTYDLNMFKKSLGRIVAKGGGRYDYQEAGLFSH